MLRAEGVDSEVTVAYLIARLRLNLPLGRYDDDDIFQLNIVASAQPDGIWRFWWPWAQPIAPVDDMATTVDHICRDVKGDEEDAGNGHRPRENADSIPAAIAAALP